MGFTRLKYLWVANLICEPPLCPVDEIFCMVIRSEYKWFSNDVMDDYLSAIETISLEARRREETIPQWELQSLHLAL